MWSGSHSTSKHPPPHSSCHFFSETVLPRFMLIFEKFPKHPPKSQNASTWSKFFCTTAPKKSTLFQVVPQNPRTLIGKKWRNVVLLGLAVVGFFSDIFFLEKNPQKFQTLRFLLEFVDGSFVNAPTFVDQVTWNTNRTGCSEVGNQKNWNLLRLTCPSQHDRWQPSCNESFPCPSQRSQMLLKTFAKNVSLP